MIGMRILTMFMVFCICACGRTGIPTNKPYESIDDLLNAIEEAGAEIVTISQDAPFFDVDSREIILNGEMAEIYKFESADASERGVIHLQALLGDAWANTASEQPSARIWSQGRLIVLYFGRDGGTILLLSGSLGDPLQKAGIAEDEPYPPAVPASMRALAEVLDVSPTVIEVVSFEAVVWPDSCLGYPEQGKGCAEVETPGWDILLAVDQRDYEIHTDEFGQEVRLSP